ncbi:hypothetical protein DFS34DRAFT_694073 [Phlyctochytrium arcticum]|nr:hypothetical protein DFS34DRAFT_694073 [Phlyctochytrium arcticum]
MANSFVDPWLDFRPANNHGGQGSEERRRIAPAADFQDVWGSPGASVSFSKTTSPPSQGDPFSWSASLVSAALQRRTKPEPITTRLGVSAEDDEWTEYAHASASTAAASIIPQPQPADVPSGRTSFDLSNPMIGDSIEADEQVRSAAIQAIGTLDASKPLSPPVEVEVPSTFTRNDHVPLRQLSSENMASGCCTHYVTKNDTLAGIAIQYGVSLSDLRQANRLWKDEDMQLLQELAIPRSHQRPYDRMQPAGTNSGPPRQASSKATTSSTLSPVPETTEGFLLKLDADLESAIANLGGNPAWRSTPSAVTLMNRSTMGHRSRTLPSTRPVATASVRRGTVGSLESVLGVSHSLGTTKSLLSNTFDSPTRGRRSNDWGFLSSRQASPPPLNTNRQNHRQRDSLSILRSSSPTSSSSRATSIATNRLQLPTDIRRRTSSGIDDRNDPAAPSLLSFEEVEPPSFSNPKHAFSSFTNLADSLI